MLAIVSLVLAASSTIALFVLGHLARRVRPQHRLASMASPWTLVGGIVVVVGIAAGAQWTATYALVEGLFAPTDEGWLRLQGADSTHTAAGVALIVSTQHAAAIAVAALVPFAWLGVWLHRPQDPSPTRVAALAAAIALSAPVLAGCAGIYHSTHSLLSGEASFQALSGRSSLDATSALDALIASTWHGVELWKWGISGVAAVMLLACTPIVVRAASRGFVVSARTYQGAQVVLLVGLAAWSTSRFATEDLLRGPIARLEVGQHATRDESRVLSLPNTSDFQLPTATECVDELYESSEQPRLLLALDVRGEPQQPQDTMWWTEQSSPEPVDPATVLIAVVDRRTPAALFEPFFIDARNRGVHKVALVTRRQHTERSLTLGELRSDSLCIMGQVDMARALMLANSQVRWSTIAYQGSHEPRPRRSN